MSADLTWPEGGLPHGEHPDDERAEAESDDFDEWGNAGRYLPHMPYPTLKPEHRRVPAGECDCGAR